MSNEILHKARKYEEENKVKVTSAERPLFHVTGQIGWINDPNGFSLYKDEAHLFYQYHPYSTHWGPMHWGHVKTKDFIKWERLPVAIAPDKNYDCKGCFSGSGVEMADGRQLLLYTGVREGDFQAQCIAIGDGINYEKVDTNPVIGQDKIPKGNSQIDFRDPKIWKDEDRFLAVVGSRGKDGSGEILLFESKDGLEWTFLEVVDKSSNEYGRMWGCPDFFKLEDKYLLMVSPQEMKAKGLEFHPGNGTVLLIGNANNYRYFTREQVQAIDYGLDFYAPQTLETKDGRRIMIAWMQNWETANCGNEERNIFGQMTVPRELSLVNGQFIQKPVREIENYYGQRAIVVEQAISGHVEFPEISGRVLDMTVKIKPIKGDIYKTLSIKVAKNKDYYTSISYNPATNIVKIDRTHSGGKHDIINIREFYVEDRAGEIELRILLDTCSIELFVNGGRQAASSVVYTPLKAKDISFEVEGEALISIEKNDLEEKLWEIKNLM